MKKVSYTLLAILILTPYVLFAAESTEKFFDRKKAEELNPFADVKFDMNPFLIPTVWMYDQNVIAGYPDGTFKPDRCVNRVEFLKLLFKIRGYDIHDITAAVNPGDRFSDVDGDEWYIPHLKFALDKEIVEGYPDGTFKPSRCVNRAEASKMGIIEFNGGASITGEPDEKLPPDLRDESQWYYKYTYHGIKTNLLPDWHTLPDNPEYHPAESMSRGETADFLYRLKAAADNFSLEYREEYEPNPVIDMNVYDKPENIHEEPSDVVEEFFRILFEEEDKRLSLLYIHPEKRKENRHAWESWKIPEALEVGAVEVKNIEYKTSTYGVPSTDAFAYIDTAGLEQTVRLRDINGEWFILSIPEFEQG